MIEGVKMRVGLCYVSLLIIFPSKHLFLNYLEYSVGKLTKERQLLVKNEHLSKLADRLDLGQFVLKNLKADYTVGSFAHIHSNCVEGVLGGVFLDGGLEEADRLYARLAFPDKVK